MSRNFAATAIITVIIYVLLYLPLGAVAALSFNAARHGNAWGGFTGQWYVGALQNPEMLGALKMTMLVAATSTVISTLIGTLLGYGLARHKFPGKKALTSFLHLSICIPDIVLAVALLLFFGVIRTWITSLQFGMVTMVLAHVTFQIPFVALAVSARMMAVDPAIEEAAYDLGASRGQRFWHVTLPMSRPGIMAGALLAFTLSLDDFVVSFFTSGAGATTLPILIYSSVKRGITPEIHALSTLIILTSTLATITLVFLRKRNAPVTELEPKLP